jgi:hypothetical protein
MVGIRRGDPAPSGFRRAIAVSVALALGVVGCGSSGGAREAQYAITPEPAGMVPGATEHFSVTPDEHVLWGITESRADRTTRDVSYPLTVSDDGRYVVDQHGRPWRVQADAGWLMSSEATPDEIDEYLSTRSAQGFNAFYLMAAVHPGGYDAASHAPNNAEGDPPFESPGDFSTAGASRASERYWAWIDSIVEKARLHGMVVMLAYTYLGWEGGDQGWYHEVLDQPSDRALFDWGRWLGNRFKDAPNIMWLGLGDYTPPTGSEGVARARVIAEGIKAAGARQLFVAEPSGPDQIAGEVPGFGSVVDLNSFYGYGRQGRGAVYETSDRAWRRMPRKPAWMQEGTYEYENNSGHFSGEPWETRRGRFWSVLAGGTAGDGFGSRDVWQVKNLPSSLSSPGADYSSAAFDLFDSLPWWELRPSGADPGFAGETLITAGQGTWGGSDYITAAATEDGDWLLAYVPVTGKGARTFDVDLGTLAGPVRARWFDPATGNYLAIGDGYEPANGRTQSFTTPGTRGDGTDDWVLVLDSTGNPRCGTITAAGVYTPPARLPDGIDCQITAALESDPSVIARAGLTLDSHAVSRPAANPFGVESSAARPRGDGSTRKDR